MSKKKLEIKKEKDDDIVVIEDNSTNSPVTEKECPKCGHGKAHYQVIQTRSSDEPPTRFYKCEKCCHTWREYK